MDVREKLVELQSIITCPNAICNFCEHFKNKDACEKHKKEVIADNMIAHGVTVQEWIPGKDRLPEPTNFVVALTTGGDRIIARLDKYGWLRYGGYETERLRPITHWMPLPAAPKGE